MSSRALKGIADSIAISFSSRNNDLDGYWALGKLYREALAHRQQTIELCLLPDASLALAAFSVQRRLQIQWQARFYWLLGRYRVRSPIVAARVTISFKHAESAGNPRWACRGDPFCCVVEITSLSGREFSSCASGHCEPHNPRQEQRSARAGGI